MGKSKKRRREAAEATDEASACAPTHEVSLAALAEATKDVDPRGPFLWPLHGAPPLRCAPRTLEAAGEPRVLLRTADYLVVEKPPDVAMDGVSQSLVTMTTLATHWAPGLPAEALPLRWCHRLDHGTSGILVLGLTKQAAAEAGRAFEGRTTQKTYSALACGHVDPSAFPWVDDTEGTEGSGKSSEASSGGGDETFPARGACVARGDLWAFRRRVADAGGSTFVVDAPLCPMAPPDFRMQVGSRAAPPGAKPLPPFLLKQLKEARTEVRVAATGSYLGAPATLLELTPHSGRRHQLRVHLAALGFPLVGDATYDGGRVAGQAPRLMLHARRLVLPLAASGLVLEVTTPDPFACLIGGNASALAPAALKKPRAVQTGVEFAPLLQVDLKQCCANLFKAPGDKAGSEGL